MSIKSKGIISTMLCLALLPSLLWAQNDPQWLILTRFHFDPKADFTVEQWKAHEKEYFDKVTQKNDLIVGSNVLVHYYTNDNSEVMFATTYRTWDDIEKADAKNEELAKAAWPDEAKRKAFFDKQRSFYTSEHSDEIRSILPNAKILTATTEHIYYVRTRHRAFPADGKPEEFKELMNEYSQNVTLKNSLLKGYYPSRHQWGADSREYIEAYVYGSLSDMEKSVDENEKLAKAHWPDEAKRKEFFKALDKYFEPWHGDALYKHVPELRKVTVSVPAAVSK
jgi:hypothetical protein